MHTSPVFRYAVAPTSLGPLVMVASEKGITDVHVTDDADRSVAELETKLGAPLRAVDKTTGDPLPQWLSALVASLEEGAPMPALPRDVRGTPFQEAVWTALEGVERGQVISYRNLAAVVGRPAAVRAVGAACGANRLALLVPCHRAIRADGGLGGYRWGLERKRFLLDRERAAG